MSSTSISCRRQPSVVVGHRWQMPAPQSTVVGNCRPAPPSAVIGNLRPSPATIGRLPVPLPTVVGKPLSTVGHRWQMPSASVGCRRPPSATADCRPAPPLVAVGHRPPPSMSLSSVVDNRRPSLTAAGKCSTPPPVTASHSGRRRPSLAAAYHRWLPLSASPGPGPSAGTTINSKKSTKNLG